MTDYEKHWIKMLEGMSKPMWVTSTTIPVKCPICGGKGLVPHGFYDIEGKKSRSEKNTSPETCRTCGGRGIV